MHKTQELKKTLQDSRRFFEPARGNTFLIAFVFATYYTYRLNFPSWSTLWFSMYGSEKPSPGVSWTATAKTSGCTRDGQTSGNAFVDRAIRAVNRDFPSWTELHCSVFVHV